MKLTPLDVYRNSREEISPIGRAINRLQHHPCGDLNKRWHEWLERKTVAMLLFNHNESD